MPKIFHYHHIWYIFSIILVASSLFFIWKEYKVYGLPDIGFGTLCITPDCMLVEDAVTLENEQQDLPEVPVASDAIIVPIFIYHSVRPYIEGEDAEQDAYDVTPQLLETQLTYLKDNGYTVITLDDLSNAFMNGTSTLPEKPVILTFDDGWRNQFVYAYPLLKKYNVPATFFVYTNPIGSLHFLTWDDIKEMKVGGMTIGSHTLTHPYFKGLSQEDLRNEIFTSKRILEEKLGVPIDHFASPFGYSNDNIVNLLSEAGYLTGRTTYWGTHQDNPLFLKGVLVSDSMNEFKNVLQKKK